MTARRLTVLGFVFLGMACGMTHVDAGLLPHATVQECAVEADLIVEGSSADGRVTVTVVHVGQAEVGDVLAVDRLGELPDVAYDESVLEIHRDEQGRKVDEAVALLFLVAGDDETFELCALGSGVRWIFGRSVYGYVQTMNPGPYELLPDRDTPTLDGLRRALAAGIAERSTDRHTVGDPDRRNNS